MNRLRMIYVCSVALVFAMGCSMPDSSTSDRKKPPVDAGTTVDAPPPAPKATPFDIVYINETTAPFNFTGLSGFLVIVNRGTTPFALSRIAVKSVTDNNATVAWQFELGRQPADPMQLLAPGHAAGQMSQRAAELFFGGRLLDSNQVFDDELMSFRWSFDVFPPVGTEIRAVARLAVEDSEVDLPFTIHVSQSEIRSHSAARVSSR
jgi:hypothetical protein